LILCDHNSSSGRQVARAAIVSQLDDRLDPALGTLIAVVLGMAMWTAIILVIW
jgi:hypothetical protein